MSKIQPISLKKVLTINKVPQQRFLVTMDVHSFYTNIPNNEELKAVERALKLKSLQTKEYISFLKLT